MSILEELNLEELKASREPYLFILALAARRFDPVRTTFRLLPSKSIGANISISTSVTAWIAVTDSLEEARRKGLERALEEWPESEGWFNHSVATERLSRAYMLELLDQMEEITAAQVAGQELGDDSLPM